MDIATKPVPVFGNAECVKFLEAWLERVKLGDVSHVAICVCTHHLIQGDSCGTIANQSEMHAALMMMKQKIDEVCLQRIAPYDPAIPANQVTYNISAGVLSFDCLPWVLNAEMERVRQGAPGPLKIAYFRNKDDKLKFAEYHHKMLEQVLMPLTDMIGAETNDIVGGKGNFSTTYKEIVEASRAGEKVPEFQPDPEIFDLVSKGVGEPITITLREATHYPHRNSNLEAWVKFGKELEAKGEEVIFVRDTAKADEPIEGVQIYPEASRCLQTRLSLYRRAKHNFFISNGPGTLNFHIPNPMTMFLELDPDHRQFYRPGWPDWWKDHHGISPGENFPWFNENQNFVWLADTYSNINEAWEKWQLVKPL